MHRTRVFIQFNDPSATSLTVEVNQIEMDLMEDVKDWLNGDYAEGVADSKTFQGPAGGYVTLHRSQVAYVIVGDLYPPPPVVVPLAPAVPRRKRWYET